MTIVPSATWVGAKLPCRGQEAPQRALPGFSHSPMAAVNCCEFIRSSNPQLHQSPIPGEKGAPECSTD